VLWVEYIHTYRFRSFTGKKVLRTDLAWRVASPADLAAIDFAQRTAAESGRTIIHLR